MSIMSLLSISNASKFITHTHTHTSSFRNDCLRVDWLFIVKTKLRGYVEIVQDYNDEVRDDVF